QELGYTNVRHYPGGLAEWNSLEPSQGADAPSHRAGRGVAARFEKSSRSLRLIDALSDQTVGELFWLWIQIVLLFGAMYWLIDWLPGQTLVTNGAPVRPNGRGFVAAAASCEGHDIPPPAATARLESIAMIFVGELHAVHDLLYRPQQTPDEAVLEAILASLASVFREFNELLRCVHAERAERRLPL